MTSELEASTSISTVSMRIRKITSVLTTVGLHMRTLSKKVRSMMKMMTRRN
jgi:hypothetical protein